MQTNTFSAHVAEHDAFNAYLNVDNEYEPHPIPVTNDYSTAVNVDGWQVDSLNQPSIYKIIHNLNLNDPNRLVVNITNVHSDTSQDPVETQVLERTKDYFVVQGLGVRPGNHGKYEQSCGFTFNAQLN